MDTNCLHSGNINITRDLEFKKFYKTNGKVEGEYIEYHYMRPDKIFKQCKFVNGLIHGKYYEYHTNNKIYTMCNYINGKIEGPFRQYYSSGKQYRTCNYINNNIHGEFKEYYNSNENNNGNLKIICNYNNGKKEGTYVRYFKTDGILGPINDIMYYKDGKLNGELISYHINGKIRTKMQYIDDIIKDTYYTYDKDGNIISVFNFVDNKRTNMILYKNGKIKETGVMIKEEYVSLTDYYIYDYEIKEFDDDDNEIPYDYEIKEYDYNEESILKKKIIKINDKQLSHLEMPVLKNR
jgi:antitoxin component YwqK of YwqJK toxin-antitoxin module